ncbi:putative lipoprotein [Leptospira kirschneri str. H2]|uniref:Putative lipoprotein n=2 Tax=Leptospira kirschneri TaxID=29507 RepID=A0A0E2B287_9LEPT|nr:putative lipoprotein [Leptospira kirschneri str. H1]EKO60688.1 putative lipoprotein [Leptospira kirschneri str. H2]EMK25086.1 putative lipoprotein [Leptospira kirschneri serovar Bulgarica str. Nikolaevo]
MFNWRLFVLNFLLRLKQKNLILFTILFGAACDKAAPIF